MAKLMKVLFICLLVAVPFTNVQAQVIITVVNGSGAVGSSGNVIDVTLSNPSEKVRAVQLDICDVDDYLTSSICETTERSLGFSCVGTELDNGCVRVTLITFGGELIHEGNGPIVTIVYTVSPSAPEGECRELNPQNEQVANENAIPLDSASALGEFCFLSNADNDTDGIPNTIDNCPENPNGPNLGTCVKIREGLFVGMGVICTESGDCLGDELCDLEQLDFDESGVGDACECRGNFDGDSDIDGNDAFIFKLGFGRSSLFNPCPSN